MLAPCSLCLAPAGTHTVQMMYGCQLNEDGTTRGIMQLGFDGEDFLTFNKETLNWTTTVQHVVPFQEERQAQEAQNRQVKLYLETTCIESLKVLLKHGKETLERKGNGSKNFFIYIHVCIIHNTDESISWKVFYLIE